MFRKHTSTPGAHDVAAAGTDRRAVLARQQERFGGVQPGAAFFGWFSALGLAALLSTVVVATGISVDLDGAEEATIGWGGVLLLVLVTLVAFAGGGYVAGRMARFDGARQGVGVVVVTIGMSVVLAVLAAVAGLRLDVLDELAGVPQLPGDLGALTLQAVTGLLGALLAMVVGAVSGGLAGMAYHRRVDVVGLGR